MGTGYRKVAAQHGDGHLAIRSLPFELTKCGIVAGLEACR